MDDFREWLSDNLRYILLGLFILLVLGLLFLGIKFISAKVDGADSKQTRQELSTDSLEDTETEKKEEVEITPEAAITPKADEALEKDKNPDVSAVIQTYYTALGSKDIAGIKSVVDSLDATEEAKIVKDPYIESYGGVETYTVDGLNDGTYIVYAVYTYKFKDIETEVPGLSQLYVCTDEDGNFFISTQERDTVTEDYIAKTMQYEKVQELIAQVQERYQEALESDEQLRSFIEALGIGDSEAASAEVGATITVKSECNVRREPDTDAEILGKLQEGQQVVKEGSQGSWIMIAYEGETGYVRSDLFQ